MQEVQFRQSPAELAAIGRRSVPVAHLNITATVIGSAQTLFTVRDNTAFEIKRLCVANVTGSAATLSLYSVPSGGTAGAGNAELVGYSIAANTSVDLTEIVGGLYAAGTTLEAFSNTNGALTIHGWGDEVL